MHAVQKTATMYTAQKITESPHSTGNSKAHKKSLCRMAEGFFMCRNTCNYSIVITTSSIVKFAVSEGDSK